jgi:hypothetical protein
MVEDDSSIGRHTRSSVLTRRKATLPLSRLAAVLKRPGSRQVRMTRPASAPEPSWSETGRTLRFMSKRTTEFQTMVQFVRQHTAADGVTVTESKFLHDSLTGADIARAYHQRTNLAQRMVSFVGRALGRRLRRALPGCPGRLPVGRYSASPVASRLRRAARSPGAPPCAARDQRCLLYTADAADD